MIGRILDWLAGGRAPWEAEPSPPKAKGGCVMTEIPGTFRVEDDCSSRQEKDGLMYVRLLAAGRQMRKENGPPPLTPEQERDHLDLVERRLRVRRLNMSLGRVENQEENEHE